MIPNFVSIDGKYRITVPSEYHSEFSSKKVFGSITHAGLRVRGSIPYNGVGLCEMEIDNARRILLSKDFFELIGVNIDFQVISKSRAIWIPCRINSSIEFLVLFGEEGVKTWKRILSTKSLVQNLTSL